MKAKIDNINLMISIYFINYDFDWIHFRVNKEVIPFSQRESLYLMPEKFSMYSFIKDKYPKHEVLFKGL